MDGTMDLDVGGARGDSCEWNPLDDDVGECDPRTPSVLRFYEGSNDARVACVSVIASSGREHRVACAVSSHAHLDHGRVCLVLLGGDGQIAYTGHYIVDITGRGHVRIEGEWTQAAAHDAAACVRAEWYDEEGAEPEPGPRPAPLSRIIFEVFGRPLHLSSAMAHSLGVPGGRAGFPLALRRCLPPLMRLGCFSCGRVLVDAVELARESRARRNQAAAHAANLMSGLSLAAERSLPKGAEPIDVETRAV